MVKFSKLFALILIPSMLVIGLTGGYFAKDIIKKNSQPKSESIPKDKYLAFSSEVYDLIKNNYWDKITDEQLTNLFVLGIEKLTKQPQPNPPKDKSGLLKIQEKILKEITEEQKKKEFTAQLADIVLANLQPFGRSRLYSQKEETDLKNRVENRNPEVDQYQVLNVKKDASAEEVKKSYENKVAEIKKDNSPEAQQKLAEVNKAYQTLSDQTNRKTYDESGVEPTMEGKLINTDIFYLKINKFSPTTIEELLRLSQKFDQGETLDTLILDLRDNVGGAIDGLPYFLGPFIGNDQYAYQFFHQGEKQDFKTKIGWLPSLVRYKKVVVLINENTQSSAEVMAATLKKYNVGLLLGTTTRGWGTVEKVFEIKQQIDPQEKFSAFLVHSLTLREDNQPIEGKGVEPIINIKDTEWQAKLLRQFHYQPLVNTVKEIINN
ncbi:MAG: S41 family peptidase [Patescibacteria group bacterium]|nr:S41 family peptidase [Patescibacteria group bacterium]